MARTLKIAAPEPSLLGPEREPLLNLSISVVTPLFGGSATPRETDPRNPVRAASVRGHLRFWWRACRGATYASADKLFEAEEGIWGSTVHPGRLTVHVLDAGREMPQGSPGYPAYAIFPFQENRRENIQAASGLEGVRFRLRIGLAGGMNDAARADLQAEAEAAVWAWLTFGGIGARTRRGCGSLYCGDARFRPDMAEPGAWLRRMAASYVTTGDRQLPMSVLQGAQLVAGSRREHPLQAWRHAIDLLREFRQAPVGRPEGKVPGRSRWPEAESIRAIERDRRVSTDAYFPRADLGLPIITHFKPGRNTTEPRDSTLQAGGKDATRMASPIILKPLALSEKEAVPLVLCLNAPHVWEAEWDGVPLGVNLAFKSGPAYPLSESHLHNGTRRDSVEPLARYGATAREAFLSYAAQRLGDGGIVLP